MNLQIALLDRDHGRHFTVEISLPDAIGDALLAMPADRIQPIMHAGAVAAGGKLLVEALWSPDPLPPER